MKSHTMNTALVFLALIFSPLAHAEIISESVLLDQSTVGMETSFFYTIGKACYEGAVRINRWNDAGSGLKLSASCLPRKVVGHLADVTWYEIGVVVTIDSNKLGEYRKSRKFDNEKDADRSAALLNAINSDLEYIGLSAERDGTSVILNANHLR